MVYRASTLRGLAIAQIVFGSLMIVFGVACILAAWNWSSRVASGVWVGVWVFITGILGYIGARDDSKPDKCLIGCFMGLSITGCVFSGGMFICYCITLALYSEMKEACRNFYTDTPYNGFSSYTDCYEDYGFHRDTYTNVAGLGSCLLCFSLVEFFLALASAIYCCMAVCCCTSPGVVSNTRTNQQVIYGQPQYMYSGAQPGMVLMQTDVGVVPEEYPVTGPPPVYIAQQHGMVTQPRLAFQQPTFWAVSSGSNPAGAVTLPYSGENSQVQNPAQVQIPEAQRDEDMPPPYSFPQTANVPPPAFSSVDASPDDECLISLLE